MARGLGWTLLLSVAAGALPLAGAKCSEGFFNVPGHVGALTLTSAERSAAGVASGEAALFNMSDTVGVRVPLGGRAYVSKSCVDGTFSEKRYASFQLLGHTLRYTVDLSGLSCGCIAKVSLLPLRGNPQPSSCLDHYCDAQGLCGLSCSEINIQESSQLAWGSDLRAVGGNTSERASTVPASLTPDWYGPASYCVNTSRPFQVSASFPAGADGQVLGMWVELAQGNCMVPIWVNGSKPLMSRFTDLLKEGLTPVISYWRADNRAGSSHQAACAGTKPASCAESVSFYDFKVEEFKPENFVPTTTSTTTAPGVPHAVGWQRCPGTLDVPGVGRVVLTASDADTPGVASRDVDVHGNGTVVPHLSGRAYFSETCMEDGYSVEQYLGLYLLGKSFSYTTDLSGASCGCVAQVSLVPMRHQGAPAQCNDYFCDAHSLCGSLCSEIDIQEANKVAWHSELHAAGKLVGTRSGYGGGTRRNGPRDFDNTTYGPGARCIDTNKPFQVTASFPTAPDGSLQAMTVLLHQAGAPCQVVVQVKGDAAEMADFTALMMGGLTPVVTYWGSEDLRWLDGRGPDGRGGFCPGGDRPWFCEDAARFSDFRVERLPPPPPPPPPPAAAPAGAAAARAAICPGELDVPGVGRVFLARSSSNLPQQAAGDVQLFENQTIAPHLSGRVYFASWCQEDYSNEQYVALGLLGQRLVYTTDLSGASCGCNAQLSLVPMRQQASATQCGDFYCDAHALCGVACSEIGIQEANKVAWHSELHAADALMGMRAGSGGGHNRAGPRDFNASTYGPRARCIDTTRPFQVAASFPVDSAGRLQAMEVTLSQPGQPCELAMRIRGGAAELSTFTDLLRSGLTPVISYWGSEQMQWLDGRGPDGDGPCDADEPRKCGDAVTFYGFRVEPLDASAASTPVPPPTCPGSLDVKGFGAVSLTASTFDIPHAPARLVGRPAPDTVEPHMAARAYFSSECQEGYSNERYLAMKLLGKKLVYTTDISGATCGCVAQVSLLPMRQNANASQCHDFYCDSRALCGVTCAELTIQEANAAAWHSELRLSSGSGADAGFGGGATAHRNLARDFNATQYGPNGICINTSRPFQVAASFPTGASNQLLAMEVVLSQQPSGCSLTLPVRSTEAVMQDLSTLLYDGVTPVVAYWGSDGVDWLDGKGADGQGPCAADTPWDCSDSVKFFDFRIEDLPAQSHPAPSPVPDVDAPRENCAGLMKVPGLGTVSVVAARFGMPGIPAEPVRADAHAVEPHVHGRAYFAESCEDSYSNEQYMAVDLLGKRFSYTTDLSRASCGCNAQLSLVPMRQNAFSSKCLDHYCDAHALCGVRCYELDIQEANMHAWHSELHASFHDVGTQAGIGGHSTGMGPWSFNASQYGPTGRCINTSRPFRVSASFPLDSDGHWEAMEVLLSQQDSPCNISITIRAPESARSEMATVLQEGLTPVVSYWGSAGLGWLDGAASAAAGGQGLCEQDEPRKCGQTVRFSDFAVEPLAAAAARSSCPGAFQVRGLGDVALKTSEWDTPRVAARPVDLLEGGVIAPHLSSRAYFSHACQEFPTNQDYMSVTLLGAKMTYTTDLSGARCGCNAQLSLHPLKKHSEPTLCYDYFCDAHGVCGVYCSELDIQEANMFAWHSELHRGGDAIGAQAGFGGNGGVFNGTGPRDLRAEDYGPGSKCIDTNRPFQVEASFPMKPNGGLLRMEVRLSQDSPECELTVIVQGNDEMMREVSMAMMGGVTPVVTYRAAKTGMAWLDGQGADGSGPCTTETPQECSDSVKFYDFTVELLSPPPPTPPPPARPASAPATTMASDCEAVLRLAQRKPHPWELLTADDLGEGILSLRTQKGQYLAVDPEDRSIRALGGNSLPPEGVFKVDFTVDGNVTILAANGLYLSALEGGILRAQSQEVGASERFQPVKHEAGLFTFRTATLAYFVWNHMCTPTCARSGLSFASTGPPALAPDAAGCQQRCAAVAGCAYFTFVASDMTCLFADSHAPARAEPKAVVAGPAVCPEDTTVPASPSIVVGQSCDWPVRFEHEVPKGWDLFSVDRLPGGGAAIRTAHDRYIGVDAYDALVAGFGGIPGEAGVFRLELHNDGSVSIRTAAGKYLSMADDGSVYARAPSATASNAAPNTERYSFLMLQRAGGRVSFRTADGRRLVSHRICQQLELKPSPASAAALPAAEAAAATSSPAVAGGTAENCTWPVRVVRHFPAGWERFTVVDQGNGMLSLQSVHGLYLGLSADLSLVSDAHSLGLFSLEHFADGTVALFHSQARYLTLQANRTLMAGAGDPSHNGRFFLETHENGKVFSFRTATWAYLTAWRSCAPACAERAYYEPLDGLGVAATREPDASDCQALCSKVAGCAHFSFFPGNSSCHLSDAAAKRAPSSEAVGGLAVCPTLGASPAPAPAAAAMAAAGGAVKGAEGGNCQYPVRLGNEAPADWDAFEWVVEGQDQVSIRSAHGALLATGEGGRVFQSFGPERVPGQVFTVLWATSNSFALQANDGRYLAMSERGDLHASATEVDERAIFISSPKDAAHVFLKVKDGRRVVAEKACTPFCAVAAVRYTPAHVTAGMVVDAMICQELCAKDASCQFFSFHGRHRLCSLSAAGATPDPAPLGFSSGPARCDEPKEAYDPFAGAAPAPAPAPPPPMVADHVCEVVVRFDEHLVGSGQDVFDWVEEGDGRVALATVMGTYVAVKPGGIVRADLVPNDFGHAGEPGKFIAEEHDDHSRSFRTSTGLYLSTGGPDGELVAVNVTSAGARERFLVGPSPSGHGTVVIKAASDGRPIFAKEQCTPSCAVAADVKAGLLGEPLWADDAVQCQSICADVPGCSFFAFRAADGRCQLAGEAAEFEKGVAGSVVAAPSCGPTLLPAPAPAAGGAAADHAGAGIPETCQHLVRAGPGPAVADEQVFEWVAQPQGRVALRTRYGTFVGVHRNGSVSAGFVDVNDEAAHFDVREPDGSDAFANTVALRSRSGRYLAVGADGVLRAQARTFADKTARFQLQGRGYGTVEIRAWSGVLLAAVRLCMPTCARAGTYFLPLDMPGVPQMRSKDASQCQELCTRQPGCAAFTYVHSDSSCHFAGANATIKSSTVESSAGPARCDGSDIQATSTPSLPTTTTSTSPPPATSAAPAAAASPADVAPPTLACEYPLRFRRDTASGWDEFEWISNGQDSVTLLTFWGKYLRAGEDGSVTAASDDKGAPGQVFRIVKHEDGTFSMHTRGNGVLVAAAGELRVAKAGGDDTGANFHVQPFEDGTVALRAWDGRRIVAERVCSPGCAQQGHFYLPMDFGGRAPTLAGDAAECQAHCAAQPGCAGFTYLARDRSCHFADATAQRQAGAVEGAVPVAGPVRCDAAAAAAGVTAVPPQTPPPSPLGNAAASTGFLPPKAPPARPPAPAGPAAAAAAAAAKGPAAEPQPPRRARRELAHCSWPLRHSGLAHPGWDRFRWVELEDGRVAIQAWHGRYLGVTPSSEVTAQYKELGAEGDRFAFTTNEDGSLSFLTSQGTYVGAAAEGTLYATETAPSERERFRLVSYPDGTVSIRTWTNETLVADRSCTPVCAEEATYEPLDMYQQVPMFGGDAVGCQAKCDSVPGCAHFTYFPSDRSCHLADSSAVRHNLGGGLVGPPRCDDVMVMAGDLPIPPPPPPEGSKHPYLVLALILIAAAPPLLLALTRSRNVGSQPGGHARLPSFADELLPMRSDADDGASEVEVE